MRPRVRALWVPGMAVTLAAQATLYVVMRSGYRPWTMGLDRHVFHSHHPLQFYLPWLAALPFIAAAGAFWSRRRGGTVRQAALAGLFPALGAFGLVLAATPLDILVDGVILRSHTLEHTFCGTAWALVSFSLAPGIALAVGLAASAAWWARRSARTAPLSAAAGAAAARPARRAG